MEMTDITDDPLVRLVKDVAKEAVEKKVCPFCGKTVDLGSFDDDRSRRESEMTGMCGIYQDDTFVEDEA